MAFWWKTQKTVVAPETNSPAMVPLKKETPTPVVIDSPVPEAKPPVQPALASAPTRAEPPKVAAPSAPANAPYSSEVARVALGLVGTGDPDAEAYWAGAIFDTSLPDKEREDLMEDLNEAGLINPQRATAADMPVIMNRLAIIEQVAPYADPFMQEHLAEACKDLLNLASGGTAN